MPLEVNGLAHRPVTSARSPSWRHSMKVFVICAFLTRKLRSRTVFDYFHGRRWLSC